MELKNELKSRKKWYLQWIRQVLIHQRENMAEKKVRWVLFSNHRRSGSALTQKQYGTLPPVFGPEGSKNRGRKGWGFLITKNFASGGAKGGWAEFRGEIGIITVYHLKEVLVSFTKKNPPI